MRGMRKIGRERTSAESGGRLRRVYPRRVARGETKLAIAGSAPPTRGGTKCGGSAIIRAFGSVGVAMRLFCRVDGVVHGGAPAWVGEDGAPGALWTGR